MRLRACLLAQFLLCYSIILCEVKMYRSNGKQIYGFVNQFQIQKIDEINPIPIPLLVLPIIIVPSINYLEDVTTPKVTIENDQNTNEILKPTTEPSLTEIAVDDNDIEINFRQSLNRGTKFPKREVNKVNPIADNDDDILKSNVDVSLGQVTNLTVASKGSNETDNNQNFNEQNFAATFTNEIEPLKLTTESNKSTTPTYSNDEWTNLTQFTNDYDTKENKTSLSENSNSSSTWIDVNKDPYTAPLYNNTMIDQVSITTNSYTNLQSPPTQNDRWMRFSSLKIDSLKPVGFRPLAGLYYDGFLHSPQVKSPGFNPNKYIYYSRQ